MHLDISYFINKNHKEYVNMHGFTFVRPKHK